MKLDIDKIKAGADKIVRESLLAKIELTNITPTRIGGYNARPYSKELGLMEWVRTSEVKGIWRWWLRATLAGALWDLNKMPNEKVIKKMVNELLGSTASTSRFTITISYFAKYEMSYDPPIREIPRMKLILMRKNDKSQDEEKNLISPNSLNVVLSLYERRGTPVNSTIRRIIFGTLLLALLLNGIGAITRRGFGHFQLGIKKCPNELSDYSNCITKISIAENEEKMEAELENLRRLVSEDAKKLLNENLSEELENRRSHSPTLPPFPSLSSDSQIFRLQVVDVVAQDEISLLKRLGDSSMKISWKKILWKKNLKIPGKILDSWILGLPREVRGTGYTSGVKRRPSAIVLAPLKKLKSSFLVAIYGFLSSDWPIGTLKWRGETRGKQKEYHVENISSDNYLLRIINSISDTNLRKDIDNCLRQKGEARIKCAFDLAYTLIKRQLTGGHV